METPYTVAAAVLAAVEEALDACGRLPGVRMVAVGSIAVDDCCEGLLAVAPERQYRTVAPFPTEATLDTVCAEMPIALSIVVSLYGCVPVITERGDAPSPEVLAVAYQDILSDAAIVWNAVTSPGILGVDGYDEPMWERALVSQDFPTAGGDCIGSETRLTLGIPSDQWCPPCPTEG